MSILIPTVPALIVMALIGWMLTRPGLTQEEYDELVKEREARTEERKK